MRVVVVNRHNQVWQVVAGNQKTQAAASRKRAKPAVGNENAANLSTGVQNAAKPVR